MADFWIKRPGGGRRRFSILRREGGKAKAVKDARLDVVNRLVKAGTLDHQQAARDVSSILEDLRRRELPERDEPEPANVALAERYWREVYAGRTHTTEDSRRSARNALDRAVLALGKAAITSASAGELQQALSRLKPQSRRMAAVFINCLLRYVGRRERVFRGKQLRPRVRWLSEAEFERLLPELRSDEERLVASVAFGTGARLGEVFALETLTLTGSVRVDRQLTSDLAVTATKTGKERTATVIPAYLPAVKRWLAVSAEERRRLRKLPWAKLVARASQKALGRRCVFHDLRHSYAVYWAKKGARLRTVAALIGDSQAVTELHYSEHFIDDGEEAYLLRLVTK